MVDCRVPQEDVCRRRLQALAARQASAQVAGCVLGVFLAAGTWGAAIALFGAVETLWAAVVLLAVAGAADFVSAVLRSTILLAATPDSMRGRLAGIELAQVAGAPALGNLEAGVLASLTSVRFSIVSGGIACVAGTAVLCALLPRFWRYRAGAETVSA